MILHVDMDALYASIEERDQPELAGIPLIIGGMPEGRGVVLAANYAVRESAVHSAMPTVTALKQCPHAIVLPPRMNHLKAKNSAAESNVLKAHTDAITSMVINPNGRWLDHVYPYWPTR